MNLIHAFILFLAKMDNFYIQNFTTKLFEEHWSCRISSWKIFKKLLILSELFLVTISTQNMYPLFYTSYQRIDSVFNFAQKENGTKEFLQYNHIKISILYDMVIWFSDCMNRTIVAIFIYNFGICNMKILSWKIPFYSCHLNAELMFSKTKNKEM